MMATDPLIKDWVDAHAHFLHWVAPAVGAAMVVVAGRWLAARAGREHKEVIDLAGEEPKS
jgi:hypothetical protein